MSDKDEKGGPLIRRPQKAVDTSSDNGARQASGPISAWGREVRHKAEARAIRAENERNEQLILRTELVERNYHAEERATAAQIRARDSEGIERRAQKQLANEEGELEANQMELIARKNKLDAETAEIIGAHAANKEENEARRKEAIAKQRQAEEAELDAEIAIELKRAKLDRLRNERGDILNELAEQIRKTEEKLASKQKRQEDLLDPVLDDDEMQPEKMRQVEIDIKVLQSNLTDLKRRYDELT